jgi:catechol 2,3-dioxygenase-like lactoylglutathione lyase family enzyme
MIDDAAVARLKQLTPPKGVPFRINKIGHVVLNVVDIERSLKFYVEVLGFHISDIYPDTMVPGGMAFMRFSPDHHGIALVGSARAQSERKELNHFAFEVSTLDEVFRARDRLRAANATIVYEGRRRAGAQVAVEFLDPDFHHLEIYWGLDQVGQGGYVRPPHEWTPTQTLEHAIEHFPPGQDPVVSDISLITPKF